MKSWVIIVSAVLVGISALVYVPILIQWNKGKILTFGNGDKKEEYIEVGLNGIMWKLDFLYRPVLNIHANLLGWKASSTTDGEITYEKIKKSN